MLTEAQNHELRDRISDALTEEGYRPRRTDHDDIDFKAEGKRLIVDFEDADPGYLRLLLPNFWPIEDAEELERAYQAANEVSELYKLVKVFLFERKCVWMSVECFLTEPEHFSKETFNRQIAALILSANAFAEKMHVLERDLLETTTLQ